MTKPIRIQRKRTKGWRKPENTVYVGRGSIYGNPIIVRADSLYIDASWRRTILSPYVYLQLGDIHDAINLFRRIVKGEKFSNHDLQYWSNHFQRINLDILKGKNLMCWCPIVDQNNKPVPCHADVLLEIVN